MTDFTLNLPTKIFFGRKKEQIIGKILSEYSAKNVLVISGKSSASKSGLLNEVFDSIKSQGISFKTLSGVVPNPLLSKVNEGIEICKKEKIDFLLAVGGGSVIDTAKAIGYGAANEGDVWDFYCAKRKPTSSLPIGVILTIAASGSETSSSSVITNEDGMKKRGCNSDFCRPKFAVMDPELTFTLPKYQTACGCTDIIMHTVERYFNDSDFSAEITDSISEALIKTVLHFAPILLKEPQNYDARANIMWAGSLSHSDLTGCGSGTKDWSCHKLEHELSGMFNVAHGAGLAAIFPSFARYVYKENPSRFARFAKNCMNVDESFGSVEEIALEGIKRMEEFFASIGMPTKISELGINLSNAEIEALASNCSNNKASSIGTFKVLDFDDMINIYRMAK